MQIFALLTKVCLLHQPVTALQLTIYFSLLLYIPHPIFSLLLVVPTAWIAAWAKVLMTP
jgi:hypothetical protein